MLLPKEVYFDSASNNHGSGSVGLGSILQCLRQPEASVSAGARQTYHCLVGAKIASVFTCGAIAPTICCAAVCKPKQG